jgi:hemin uptake protein HemP
MFLESKADTEGAAEPSPSRPGSGERLLDSRALFGGAQVVLIHHEGSTYTLRKTRNGKLILTK